MKLSYTQAIKLAFDESLTDDSRVMLFGLGVGDAAGVFGTTKGLQEKFGSDRVFDIPLSENAVTGMALGLAMQGFKPVMVHQRSDFSFTSAEQIFNQIAKARYMSNDTLEISIVIRMIVGRGWGQGPTHAQSPHAIFSHIPGLQVVAPATPSDGFSLMRGAIDSGKPVIFLEHRWLHQTVEEFSPSYPNSFLNSASVVRAGKDLSLISLSYGVLECLKMAEVLRHLGVDCEVINLRTINPLDFSLIFESVKKTKRAVFWDIGHKNFGISGEISHELTSHLFHILKAPVLTFGLPHEPTPSSPYLAIKHYLDLDTSIENISQHFKFNLNSSEIRKIRSQHYSYASLYRDQPEVGEVGPF